jgi:hypothetical protein
MWNKSQLIGKISNEMTFYIEMKKRKIFETYLNNIIKKSEGKRDLFEKI